jgi:DNA-binding winged helix-turn-helix (wHTH) protein
MVPSKLLAHVVSFDFGPFRFIPSRRLLLHGDSRVKMGDRARAVLHVLVERPGEIIGSVDLIARVWPRTIVDSGTLRVHMVALRKALARGARELHCIETIHGYGYRFAAPVRRICVATELFCHPDVLEQTSPRPRQGLVRPARNNILDDPSHLPGIGSALESWR